MTTEEAIKQLKEYILGMNYMDDEAVWMAINALEAQPCEDCVSREALRNLKVSVPIAPIFIGDNYIRYRDVIIYDEIIDLPSVTPTRPTGK